MINISGLNVDISGQKIIKDLTCTFERNNFYCIFGKSGSGKTTLLRVMANLIPYLGVITVDNIDIKTVYPPELRRRVLFVPQSPPLSASTVKNNILEPFYYKINKTPVPSEERIKELMAIFMLDEGYYNKSVEKLSGGEKQRIHLIRSILLSPEYILLDEPTSALDIKTVKALTAYFKKLKNEMTIISISHSIEYIVEADIKIHFGDGHFLASYQEIDEEHIRGVINDQD